MLPSGSNTTERHLRNMRRNRRRTLSEEGLSAHTARVKFLGPRSRNHETVGTLMRPFAPQDGLPVNDLD